MLHYTVNQRPHWACPQYGHSGGTWGWLGVERCQLCLQDTSRSAVTSAISSGPTSIPESRVTTMVIPVVEFSREGYKIRKVFGLKSTVVK